MDVDFAQHLVACLARISTIEGGENRACGQERRRACRVYLFRRGRRASASAALFAHELRVEMATRLAASAAHEGVVLRVGRVNAHSIRVRATGGENVLKRMIGRGF